MGRFKSALEIYDQARKLGLEDWVCCGHRPAGRGAVSFPPCAPDTSLCVSWQRMHLDCSICHFNLGDTQAAELALNQAMALNCTVSCLRHLATLRTKARDLQGAIDALEDALK